MSIHGSTGELTDKLKPAVVALRIVVGAMPIGIVAFAVIAVWLRLAGTLRPADSATSLLTSMAIGLAVVALALGRFVPEAFVRRARAKIAASQFQQDGTTPRGTRWAGLKELGAAGQLFAVYQRRTTFVGAVFEGAAFLNVAAFLLGGSPIALVAAGLLVVAILAQYPTMSRVTAWIEQQLRLLGDEQSLAR